MAKLTSTEIKTLATEAYNRVNAAAEEANKKLKASDEYLSWPKNFENTTLGKSLNDLILQAKSVEKLADQSGFEAPGGYGSDEYKIASRVERYADKMEKQLLMKTFPMKNADTLPAMITDGRWNTYRGMNLLEQIEHKLRLEQLTSDQDLSKLLDDIVKELIAKL